MERGCLGGQRSGLLKRGSVVEKHSVSILETNEAARVCLLQPFVGVPSLLLRPLCSGISGSAEEENLVRSGC